MAEKVEIKVAFAETFLSDESVEQLIAKYLKQQ
jgi:hypothetical protein